MNSYSILSSFSQQLLKWYDANGRKDLPWRQQISPYRVWLSEVMLQQTQVNTVIPYFLKFLQHFPTLPALATAELDEVLNLWAGLGYYARARNLHRTAQLVMENYQGEFPNDIDALQQLPGIGRSTAGAIMSIAYNQSHPILDGNVKRVLARQFAVLGWPGDTKIIKQLWQHATSLLPEKRCNDYTQALMDLGATICTKSTPQCIQCPVASLCEANQQGIASQLPLAKPQKQSIPTKTTFVLLIQNIDQTILLERRPPAGIWGGLWSLPEAPLDSDIVRWCAENYGMDVAIDATDTPFRHTFTHYHLWITPVKLKLLRHHATIMESVNQVWYKSDEVMNYALPAPIKRLLENIL